MRTDTGAVRQEGSPPGPRPVRSTGRRSSASCSRVAPSSATTTSSGRATRTSTRRSRSGPSDIDKAKSLLSTAGVTNLTAHLHAGQLQEIPDLAVLLKSQAAEAGITLNVGGREPRHVLRRAVVPGRPGGPAVLRRSRARHRRLRPPGDARRLPQCRAQDEGHLELVAVHLAGVRRRVHRVPGGGRRRRPEGGLHQDRDHPQRGRPGRPAVLLQLPRRQLEQVHGRLLERPRADVVLADVAGLTSSRVGAMAARRRPRLTSRL